MQSRDCIAHSQNPEIEQAIRDCVTCVRNLNITCTIYELCLYARQRVIYCVACRMEDILDKQHPIGGLPGPNFDEQPMLPEGPFFPRAVSYPVGGLSRQCFSVSISAAPLAEDLRKNLPQCVAHQLVEIIAPRRRTFSRCLFRSRVSASVRAAFLGHRAR